MFNTNIVIPLWNSFLRISDDILLSLFFDFFNERSFGSKFGVKRDIISLYYLVIHLLQSGSPVLHTDSDPISDEHTCRLQLIALDSRSSTKPPFHNWIWLRAETNIELLPDVRMQFTIRFKGIKFNAHAI